MTSMVSATGGLVSEEVRLDLAGLRPAFLGVRRRAASHEEASVVATDGTVTHGPYPESKAYIGGFSVVDVPTHEEALRWAGRIAVACRCAQEVREFGPGSTP